MKKFGYKAVEFKKDKNILTTTIDKIDNTTGEVVGRTSYAKDLNRVDEHMYCWHRVLKYGNISTNVNYIPADIDFEGLLEEYGIEFISEIDNLFWKRGDSYYDTFPRRQWVLLYLDILMANRSTLYSPAIAAVQDAIIDLRLQEDSLAQYFIDLVALREECGDSYEYRDMIQRDLTRRQDKIICENLHITENELQMLKDDNYWDNCFYRNYLIGNTNAIILYLKLYNAYRTVMPTSYLRQIACNAIKKAKANNIEYKVKGNPMDIVKNIADIYASIVAKQKSEELVEVNKIIKYNQTSIPLTFEDDKFIVKVPTTYEELLAEGTALRNCLGHYEYNNYVKNGRRRIVFIREKSNPDKSFIACDIDVYENEIMQYLKYGNNDVHNQDALNFREKYQTYLNTLIKDCDTMTTDLTDDDLVEQKFNQW